MVASVVQLASYHSSGKFLLYSHDDVDFFSSFTECCLGLYVFIGERKKLNISTFSYSVHSKLVPDLKSYENNPSPKYLLF